MEADVLHTKRLDWAFAGTSSSEIKKLPDGSNIVHSRWQHWVDSRTEQAETVADEGDMFPQTDGTTLETGRMVNPATGLPTDYEERWRDVEPISTERSGGGAEEGRKVCVVLQLHDDVNRARGMVVRVGQFCQGLLRVRDGLSLERWEWESEKGWRRMAKMGDMWLPCGVLLEGEKLRLGGEVKYGEFAWKVVEMSDF